MIKLFKNLGKREFLIIIICISLVLCQVWLDLRMPDYMSKITVLVQTEGSNMTEILKNGGYMILCAFGSLISAIIVGYLSSNLAATFSMKIRKRLFTKVENLSMSEIKHFSASSLITRTTNDITQIQMLVAMGLQMAVKAPITAIWAVAKILNKSWQWSAITGAGVVILLGVVAVLMALVLPRFKKVQKLTDKLNGITRENLTGIRVVHAFNAEEYQEEKFEKVNTQLTNYQLFNQRAFSILSPVMYLIMYFLTLSIYFVGAKLIQDAMVPEKIQIFGNMVVFSSYAMQVIMSFLMLAMIFMMYPRAQVSANRINEVLETKSSIIDGKISKDGHETEYGTVEFKNVSFKYPDAEEYLLQNISFKAEKGETVAFIGSTGSGKTTLINLIPRFYDATDGEVLVDGVNVKEYKQEFLYKKLGYVSQKAIIFNDSIKNNVGYGIEEISEIKNAIEVAQAKEFVEKMEFGYDTNIAQNGTNISGGQKQRISIARAIAKNPEIYIFDDSFSALDYKTDSLLRKELKRTCKDSTILIVAQRVGTIMSADKIVVLDEGKIVGFGKHEDLMSNCEVYKQIAESQKKKKRKKGERNAESKAQL